MRLAVTLALVLQLTPALADDEASEHTAQLAGDPADTLGVIVNFAEKTGWSMTIRPRPGANEKTVKLPIPAEHAHYLVYVAPKRAAVAIVEVSTGVTTQRPKLAKSDGLAWVFAPDGSLRKRFSYGDVFTQAELDGADRSISHWNWMTGSTVTKRAINFTTSKRTIELDAVRTKFR